MTTKPKVIVAVWHRANQGKPQTLRALAEQLISEHRDRYPGVATPLIPENPAADVSLEIEFDGVKVCVESQGDPGTDLETRLRALIKKSKADLIFCTTRTRGETPGAVDRVAEADGHQVIWTSTYQTDRDHTQFNWLKARHLLELVKERGFLP